MRKTSISETTSANDWEFVSELIQKWKKSYNNGKLNQERKKMKLR